MYDNYIYIIADKEYVLTPGFSAKLFAIHSRINAGQNIILSGDTVRYLIFITSVKLTLASGDWKN